MHTYTPSRHGITLLVVLVLMVMFAMLVTAFMVIVTHSRRAVESVAQRRVDPPLSEKGSVGGAIPGARHIELAFQRLLVGSSTLDNVIAPHSILENLYGHTAALRLDNTDPSNLAFTVTTQDGLLKLQLMPSPLSAAPTGQVIGHVVTVQRTQKTDPLHNKSTVVVNVDVVADGGNRIETIYLAPFSVVDTIDQGTALTTDCVLLFNPPAHSGTGAGFVTTAASGNAWLSETDNHDNTIPTEGKPLALRPNIIAPNGDGTQQYKTYLQDNDVRMNPDYTAPDFMTMFLAWNDIQNNQLANIIPSFHRPQLVKYWQNARTDDPPVLNDDIRELRKYVLRPLPMDHPDFTGGNPAAKWYGDTANGNIDIARLEQFLIEGPWDVDNDGDGIADGIWLDVGLAPEYDAKTLSWYKPLVSYYVLDMDGSLNVNTLGNLAQFETPYELSEIDRANGSIADKGTGLGSAELTPTLLKKQELLIERYGDDKKPGGTTNNLLLSNGINLPAYTQGGLFADWFGYSPILFDNLGNRRTATPSVETINPYLMNPYSDTAGDEPFTADDLEMLLRSVVDLDYNALSPRLRDLLDEQLFEPTRPTSVSNDLRYNVTTRSSDIPASATIYQRLQTLCDAPNELWMLLPEEIRRGGKVNLNRLTLLQNWTSTTPLTAEQYTELIKAKARFTQEIYYLLRILIPMDKQNDLGRERLAQWSVNIVDFIDPDDVMTPFIYKKTDTVSGKITVFSNEVMIDTLLMDPANFSLGTDYALLWGFEKPEIALTETLAFHDRKVADTSLNNYTNTPSVPPIEPDPTFDQVTRPQGSLFVELYRQGNPQRTYPVNSVVDFDGTLNLAKKTGGTTGDYVWRLAIGEPAKTTTTNLFDWQGEDKSKNALEQLMIPDASGTAMFPQFRQWRDMTLPDYHPDLGMPERFIWFGNELPAERQPITTSNFDHAIQLRSFYNDENNDVVLSPNSTLVIAPRTITALPRQTFDFSDAAMLPSNTKTMIAVNPDVSSSTGQIPLGANVSEPLPTFLPTPTPHIEDGYLPKGTTPNDIPFDDGILKSRGTIPCYKTIALQRLTDPNRPHHPIGNPYITVDWNMIDLHVFTSEQKTESDDTIARDEEDNSEKDDNMTFASREWNSKTASFINIWDRIVGGIVDNTGTAIQGKAGLPVNPFTQEDGAITTVAKHSLGTPPSALTEIDSTDPENPITIPAPPQLHFPFHDAPLMNSGELMLVPASAPGRFGVEFHDNGTTENFFGRQDKDLLLFEGSTTPEENPRFGYHYQNFAYSPYLNWGLDNPAYMLGLFDFVHVPSRFAGTIQGWTTGTNSKPIYSMREPGKLNLNTLTEEGWKSLENGRANFLSYAEFRASQQWSAAASDPNFPSEFKPFRSPSGTHFVPPLKNNPEGLYDPANATLMGLKDAAGESALVNESASNPYTALENTLRLSDVTTTRSNVFAVWMTVGYFNVEKFDDLAALQNKYPGKMDHISNQTQFSAIYPDGYVLGSEKGLNDGTMKRHRSFYLIDRSTPVGFRRGEKLNSENVIIKKTVLD